MPTCIAWPPRPAVPDRQQIPDHVPDRKGTPGFRVGRALDKHGWRSSDTAELLFEDCVVPETSMLGGEGNGFYAIMRNFQNERIVIGAMAMGEAQAALDLTISYLKTRKAFGDAAVAETGYSATSRNASGAGGGRPATGISVAWRDAQGHDVTREVSMLKAYCGELVNDVMYDCVQFHGGMGFMRESVIERMSRDARVQSIGGGASEVMLEEVAKRL